MDFSHLFESIIPLAERLPVLRAVLGFIVVFFLPGFVWSLSFFNHINIVERVALSFGLSIAAVTLGVIVLHVLLGIRITGSNALLYIILITIIAFGLYLLKLFVNRRRKASDGE